MDIMQLCAYILIILSAKNLAVSILHLLPIDKITAIVLDDNNVQVNTNHECLELLEIDHNILTNTTDQISSTQNNELPEQQLTSCTTSILCCSICRLKSENKPSLLKSNIFVLFTFNLCLFILSQLQS